MLLSACLPDDENIKRRLLIEQITESKEYRELKIYEPMQSVFERLFSKDTLAKLPVDKLEGLNKAIPIIIPTVSKVINTIKYGNAWELDSDDIPDFYSYDSLVSLAGKCNTDNATENITNITDNQFLAIFSKKTVKSISSLEGSLTVEDLSNINHAIEEKLTKTSYCVNPADLNKIKEQFDNAMGELDKYELSIKSQKRSGIERKILLTAAVVLSLAGISSFGLVHSSGFEISMIAAIIATVIYWIKG